MHPSRHARRSLVAVVGSLLILAGLLPPGTAPVFAVSTTLVINEVDYDQASTDTAEFLELKNVGAAPIDLDPYIIELVNGATNTVYLTIELPAFSLAPGGLYVVCGNASLTANCSLDVTPANQDVIQNGAPDAIGLRLGMDLVDAVSYEGSVPGFTEGPTAPTDTGPAAPAPPESISRCPDGTDSDDNGADFDLRPITPGAANSCVAIDTPPTVATTSPANGAMNVAVASNVSITFSEAVTVADGWFTITCATTGAHAAVASGGPVSFTLNPGVDFGVEETCTVTILAANVTDQDAPPDAMAMDHAFSFATAAAVNPAQPLPFLQNWTDIEQITTNDDWSGVPGILGFLGQDITTATGTDPQTLLGVSALANDIDIIANQTSTTITSGGVAEFHIPDPVVGLNGSGTADAPHLLINVSTSGHTDVRVSYNLRDLDASADNAAMQVALQYRIGTTGDFTNLPDGYVADATTADSATQVTPVSVLLPVAAWNQPWIQVRIITTNAVGNDEWVGVDDIAIVPNAADNAPAVASTVPANGATGVALDANISVTFDEPVSVTGEWFAISCDVSGAHVATASGGPDTFALDPAGTFASLELCTVTIEADGVSDNDILDPPQFMAADFVFSFSTLDASVCGDPATQIHQIQGSGASTPMPNATVSVEGIVTGDFNGTGGLGGFYIQDDSPDADPATSDGLFVGSTASVSAGDLVRVSGTAIESFGETRVNAIDLQLCGTGIIAPQVYDLPRPAGVTFEPVEGMLLTFPEALTATEHFQLGRFGEVTVSANGRLLQPTDHVAPGAPAQVELELAQRRRLLIDDGSNVQNPTTIPHLTPQAVRIGDTATGITGVLGFGFSLYRLQPTQPISFARTNPRPMGPEDVAGDLKVASFNTLNYFTTLTTENPDARGANSPQEFARQQIKEVEAITGLDADILGLMEVENNGTVAISSLVDALNAATAPGTYAFITEPAINPPNEFGGEFGTDAIKVSIIYRPAAVTPVGPAQTSADPIFDRPPLIQTFQPVVGGEAVTVIVNHFKSKNCAAGSAAEDEDQGDGQSCFNGRRVRQAEKLLDVLATLSSPNSLIVGDLNAYTEEDPIHVLEDAGYVGLSEHFIDGADRYSFVFDGFSGELDHALASPELIDNVTDASIWHINADEPLILDYNLDFGRDPGLFEENEFRASDHDPLIVGLDLQLDPLYLHNNPTPPMGNTRMQHPLPMNEDAPTATTLFNYDSDRDSRPGRVIQKGGSATTTDRTKFQNWRTQTFGRSVDIEGDVTFEFWSAMKDFKTDKRGHVTAYLMDGSTVIATASLRPTTRWQGGSSTWVEKSITFTDVDRTIAAGRFLQLRVVVGNSSADDMWFAYDTASFQSTLILP